MKKNLVIVCLCVLLLGSCGYILYDKVLGSVDSKIVNNKNEEVITEEESNDNSNEEVKSNDSKEVNNYFSEMSKYKNHDGTFGTVKSIDYSIGEFDEVAPVVTLKVDGKVYVKSKKKQQDTTLNISDVVDIVAFNDAGCPCFCYMITLNGDVYYYGLENVSNNIYDVVKVDKLSNIARLAVVYYGPLANAGGAWTLLATTKDNKVISVDTKGV